MNRHDVRTDALVEAFVTYVRMHDPVNSLGVKVTTPDKCAYEMPYGSYRKWHQSMNEWIKLSRPSIQDAVLSLKLSWDDALQKAVDAIYPEGVGSHVSRRGI